MQPFWNTAAWGSIETNMEREQEGHLMKAAGSLGGEFKGRVQPLNEDAGKIPVIATGSEQWES